MFAFLTSTHHLTQPLIFENEDINLVVTCDIYSTQAISLKVKNLIILGHFFQDKEPVLFSSKEDIFFIGKMIGNASFELISEGRTYGGRNEEILKKIRKLGLDIVLRDDGIMQCYIPKGSVRLNPP